MASLWGYCLMLNNIVGVLGVGGGVATNFDSIQTYTVGAGGQASITFSSISGTYKHLQIRYIARNTTSSGGGAEENVRLRVNGVTTANYPWHILEGDGATAYASAATTDTSLFVGRIAQNTATASTFGVNVIDILDYTNTNKYKTIRSLQGMDRNGAGYVGLFSGFNTTNTNAITSIDIFPQAGSFAQYSHFALYGIKA